VKEPKNCENEQIEKFSNIESRKEGTPQTFKPPNFVRRQRAVELTILTVPKGQAL